MNSAYNDNQAATKAVRIARVALRSALACALVFGAGTAFSQQYGGERRDDQQQQPQQQHQGRERFSLPQDRGQRESDMRDDQRRAQQQQQQQQQYAQPQRDDPRRASGRLTPDERRDLRRQINEAGMDLYPRNR